MIPARDIPQAIADLITDTIKFVAYLALYAFLAGGIIGLLVFGWRAL